MAMAQENVHPMLIVIGGMKCGTTSLHRYLSTHPELSVGRKELNFFSESKNWQRGLDWYRSQFDEQRATWVDVSVDYAQRSPEHDSADLIRRVAPNATLVYLVRNPVERAVSHYMHHVFKGLETRSLAETMTLGPAHHPQLNASRYYYQLEAYLPWFDRSQIMLFDFDELVQDSRRVCRRIFERVGVDPDFEHPEMSRVFNVATEKRYPTRLGRRLMQLPAGRAVRTALLSPFERRMTRPVLDEAQREQLIEYLRPDVEALQKWWGRDLSHWLKP